MRSSVLLAETLLALGVFAAPYSAAALGSLVPLPDSVRPILPPMRPVLERLEPDVRAAISPALLAHRDRIAPKYFALASATA